MRNRHIGKACRRSRLRVEIHGQRNCFYIIEIEKLLGRGRRTVRLIEAQREKERLVFVSIKKVDRARRDLVITMRLAVAIEHNNLIRCRTSCRSIRLRRVIWIISFLCALTGRNRTGRTIDDVWIDRLAAFGP